MDIDLAACTPEQRAFLEKFIDDETHLNAYDLSSADGRRSFLWRFSEKGDESIFEAVSVVWEQLAAPKSYRCAKMAKAAGLPGGGKTALRAVLLAFLHEFNSIEVSPVPDRNLFESFAEWNALALAGFAEWDVAVGVLLDRYDQILDGVSPLPHSA